MHAPPQLVEVGLVQQFLAEVALVEAAVLGHLQHEVGAVGRDANLFHLTGIRCVDGKQGGCCHDKGVFHGMRVI